MKLRPHQQKVLNILKDNNKGYIVSPVGSGKTIMMIEDSRRFLFPGNVVLVVAPQLLLATQLFNEFNEKLSDVDYRHLMVGSFDNAMIRRGFLNGQAPEPTTNTAAIREAKRKADKFNKPLLIISTYNSLERIVSSGIEIDAAYYDESHNAVQSNFFPAVKEMSAFAKNNFFFTASPKVTQSGSIRSQGMNNEIVFGKRLIEVPFYEMIQEGYLVQPLIHLMKSDVDSKNKHESSTYVKSIQEVIEHHEKEFPDVNQKILFNCRGTKTIKEILNSEFVQQLQNKGYEVLSIDSVNQGFVSGVNNIKKSKFIQHLNDIGNDPSKKMIVLHVGMLGEGIDIRSFTSVVFLRNVMDDTFTYQSIGRVLRAAPGKKLGVITVVQHHDDSGEAYLQVTNILNQLYSAGVPKDAILSEINGRGEEEEIIENLKDDALNKFQQFTIQWEHNQKLMELLEVDYEDLNF